MMKRPFFYLLSVVLFLTCFSLFATSCVNQTPNPTILLDNYFNHEVNSQGKLFHYIWSDNANSGFSEWGKIFNNAGIATDTLQQAPTLKRLDKATIYMIVDPDTKAETKNPHYITSPDINTIVKWVKKGGILVLMANDSGDCEFTHLNNLVKHFGLHFNEVRKSHEVGTKWNMAAFTDLKGTIFSKLHKIYIKDASTLTLSGDAKPLLTKNGYTFMAVSPKGKGFVVAVTDPWFYNEYIGHKSLPKSFQNYQAAQIFTQYLLKLASKK